MSGGLSGLMKYRYQKKEEKKLLPSPPPSISKCNVETPKTPENKKVTANVVPVTPDSGKPSPVFNSIKKAGTGPGSDLPNSSEKQSSSVWLSKETLAKRKLETSPPSQTDSSSANSSSQNSTMSTSSSSKPLTDEDREILSLLSSLQGVFPQKPRAELERALDAADNNYDRAVNFLIDGRFVDFYQKKRSRDDSNVSSVSSCGSTPVKRTYKRIRIMSSDDEDGTQGSTNNPGTSTNTQPSSTSDKSIGSDPFTFLREAFPAVPDATIVNILKVHDNNIDTSMDALTELCSKQVSQTKNVGSIKAMKEARDIAIATGQTVTSPSPVKSSSAKHKFKSKKFQNGDAGSEDDWNDEDDEDADGDSSDEDSGVRRLGGQEEVIRKFLNEASLADLLSIGGCSKKKADFLMEIRPFDSWDDMVMKLDQSKVLSFTLVEECKELLRIRNNVQNLMKKCERISQELEEVISELTTKTSIEAETTGNRDYIVKQPSILNETMKLTPYQLVGLNWLMIMHEQELNGILGDEMGLGKTIQTIAFLAQLKEFGIEGPHLIIAPSSTLDNWLRELKTWCPSLNVMLYYGSQEERQYLRQKISSGDYDEFDVAVTTYNMATGSVHDRNMFKKFNWHYAVFDEGHMLKNMTSIRYKTLHRINADRRLLLTGTPLQNNLIELMSLLAFVMPDLFTNKTDHLKRIFATMTGKSGDSNQSAYEAENVAHAKRILKPFFLRRLKTEVLKQLPQKKEKVEHVPMAEEQQELYDGLKEEFSRTVTENASSMSGSSGAAMMMQLRKAANHHLLHRRNYDVVKLRRMAKDMLKEPTHTDSVEQYVFEDMEVMSDFELHRLSKQYRSLHKYQLDEQLVLESGKFRYLDELLPKMKSNGSRVLLFSQFTMMLDIIEVYMKLRSYKFIRLDGQTVVADRQDLIDRFNNDNSIFIFLLSTKAGGLGINLTAANVVVLHDIDFNPYNDKQAEDRCHRLGQKRDVMVYRLLSTNSIEEGMWKCAQAKLKLEQDVTGSGEADDICSKDAASLLKETLNIHSRKKSNS